MNKNRITRTVVVPYSGYTIVYIHRLKRGQRRLNSLTAVNRVLRILSEGAYTSVIDYEPTTNAIKSFTYTPMQFSESKYREVLRAIYLWFHSNVDGFLEDNEQADYFWHLLGAMVADTFVTVWSRKSHLEAFYEEVDYPDKSFKNAWKYFFTHAKEKR